MSDFKAGLQAETSHLPHLVISVWQHLLLDRYTTEVYRFDRTLVPRDTYTITHMLGSQHRLSVNNKTLVQYEIHKPCPKSPEFHCVLFDTGWCNDFIKNARKINSTRTQVPNHSTLFLDGKRDWSISRFVLWSVINSWKRKVRVEGRKEFHQLEIAKDDFFCFGFLRILVLQQS